MTTTPFRTITPSVFMRRYWHKRSLLLRQVALDGSAIVDLAHLQRLAARDDVESRVVIRSGRRWILEHGPFPSRYWRTLPRTHWTLLVQGINLVVPAADRLLRQFAFVAFARLDDVMVSYAAPQGGVGPHVDSYDVFLLQGPGRRRWRVSRQRDLLLDARAPLKILTGFHADDEWVLESRDMLYLPPQVAHEGIALEPCFTFSIGFRAPAHDELRDACLAHLHEANPAPGRYADPHLRATGTPAALPSSMIDHAAALVRRLPMRRGVITDALGIYLSTPKATIVFEPPGRVQPVGRFAAIAAVRGLVLDPRTIMLYDGNKFFINGEPCSTGKPDRAILRKMANERALSRVAFIERETLALVHGWYRAGWVQIG